MKNNKFTSVFSVVGMAVLLSHCVNADRQASRQDFQAADTNGDGKLSLEEAHNFELARVFKLIDYDQSGAVSLQEAKDIAPEFSRKTFDEYDRNRDGKVTYAEYAPVRKAKGYIKQRFDAADANKDGYVTLKEADARVQFLQVQAGGEM